MDASSGQRDEMQSPENLWKSALWVTKTVLPYLRSQGLPDDIGGVIAALLSEDNRWVNAQRIEVSGGQSI